MSKVEGLKIIRENLTLLREAHVRALLYREVETDTRPRRLAQVGLYSVLLGEVRDHIHNLNGIAAACRHGLAGTAPATYDMWAAGNNEAAVHYDPHQEIAHCLESDCKVSALQLSPELLDFINTRPEAERGTSAFLLDFLGKAFWERDDAGTLRPLTESETAAWPERSMMKSYEQTFFALTYAEDLAAAHALTKAGGDLQAILLLTL
jgi:hypothetical protein